MKRAGLACLFLAFAVAPAAAGDAAFPLSCTYFRSDLDTFEGCARREGERVRINLTHIARMHFERGLVDVRIAGIGCLWARRDGLAVPVFLFDNGSDPFVHGLTRGRRGGKVAFFDRRLRLVLATPYDWSFPFNGRGEALVCEGCRSDEKPEYSSMVGGRWGLIDRKGRLVMPLTEGDAPSHRYFDGRG